MAGSVDIPERYPHVIPITASEHGTVCHHVTMHDVTEIASYQTVFSAEIAVAHLESVGIDASIATDNAGGAFPSMTGLSGARVIVRSEDAERAKDALSTLEDPDAQPE